MAFVSASNIEADRYAVQVDEEAADEAMRVLSGMPATRRPQQGRRVPARCHGPQGAAPQADKEETDGGHHRRAALHRPRSGAPCSARAEAARSRPTASGERRCARWAVGRRPDRGVRRVGGRRWFYLPKDGIVGIMVDALSGPTGAVFARRTESFRGQGARPTYEAERELVLGEVSRTLEPGVTIVIAEITHPDPGVLDAAVAALGGSVTRKAARDVYAELRRR